MQSPSKDGQSENDDGLHWHVVPVGDLIEHENTPDCWCEPVLDPYAEGTLYIHNAIDGREGDFH